MAARANFLASDRPELQFASKDVCWWMASPTELALGALKRVGRFLAGHQRLVYHYPWQTVTRVDADSDTNLANVRKPGQARPVAAFSSAPTS